MFALTSRSIPKLISRILGRKHTNLKGQIFTTHLNPSNPPPPKEGLDINPIKLSNLILHDLPSNLAGVSGQVIIRRKGHSAFMLEKHGEIAGGGVDSVGLDVSGE